jgi:hypothetical protein
MLLNAIFALFANRDLGFERSIRHTRRRRRFGQGLQVGGALLGGGM